MKKLSGVAAAVLLSAAILFSACGGGGGGGGGFFLPPSSGTTTGGPAPSAASWSLIATGGNGATGVGGEGGYLGVVSTGAAGILKSGSVDASFTVSAPTPSFGATHAIVTSGTVTVLLASDPNDGNQHIYTKPGDSQLYLGNGNGNATDDPVVTGLTINTGATLVLVDQNAVAGSGIIRMTNDMVIYGTLTNESGKKLIACANLIDVEKGGKITTSATTADASATELHLGDYANVGKIINRGSIEAKGLGSGNGGTVFLDADDLVVNYGTIDTSGGSSATGQGGSAGDIDIYAYYGNFYSSGTVRANGGDGGNGNGGSGGYVWVETADTDNTHGMNGDIIISGTWESIGGSGTNGRGGDGNYLGFETDAMGNVTVNASMSERGGKGTGATASGGYGGLSGIEFYSYNYGSVEVTNPGKIRISGNFDFRGGDGDLNGGAAGGIWAESDGANSSFKGVDVELVGFPNVNLNGGNGGTQVGWAGKGGSFWVETVAPQPGNWRNAATNKTNTTVPAGPITNEANIQGKGGNATAAGGKGGNGGITLMFANAVHTACGNASAANATTVINNSGNIDHSAGTGDTGGDSNSGLISSYGLSGSFVFTVGLQAQHVTTSGNLSAKGASGTTTGGAGGYIYLMSLDHATTPTNNTGALSMAGGTGGTTNGSNGTITIDGVVQ